MKIVGVIIAGGKSTRMAGREKALLPLCGKPVISHIIERLRPQVEELAINANGDAERFAAFGLPFVPDASQDVGTPLAGLEAALLWAKAKGAKLVLTVPSDTPLLPVDLVDKLAQAGAPAMAASEGQEHYLTTLWPVSLSDDLSAAIRSGLRPVKAWARNCGVSSVPWPATNIDPFFNINTPEDLARVELELRAGHA